MTNIAIENTPFIVDFPIENGGSFHSYVNVYQAGYQSQGSATDSHPSGRRKNPKDLPRQKPPLSDQRGQLWTVGSLGSDVFGRDELH